MRRMHRIVLLIAGLLALAPVLAGCADFDMDKLDVFDLNEKKKLPGERKEVFPDGVPGVTQGIPPEYLKGNQQQADTALTPDAAAPPPAGANPPPASKDRGDRAGGEPKPKPKAQAEAARRRSRRPPSVTVQPAATGSRQRQQKLAPWPGTAPRQQPAARAKQRSVAERAAAARHVLALILLARLASSRQSGTETAQ